MHEAIYNILYFVHSGSITHAAIRTHHADGSNQDKAEWLRSSVASDLAEATPILLPKPINHDTFMALQRLGRHLEVFDPLFQAAGAPREPFYCMTAIVDGRPTVDICTDHAPLTAQIMQSMDTPTLSNVEDWLTKYATGDGFDLPRLLNDDYFQSIRLLFKAQQYVSCMKLLVSFIDTVAFLAYGDAPSVFVIWMETYVALSRLGITPQELWELRNGLLHMTTLDSRKVVKKTVRRIGFCVAPRGTCAPADGGGLAYFNLLDLIDVVANGISDWTEHINANRDEFVHFVERYDRIISDDRRTYIAMPQPRPLSDPTGAPEG